MTSNPFAVRTAVLSVLAAAILSGCQWVDTRPEVAILPAGDLTGGDFLDLQVDAEGARQARILVDGRPWGDPFPTGVPVHVDIRDLARGDHELVARVEQGGSPRSSAPRRLTCLLTRPDLPLSWTAEGDPWKPYSVTFRAEVPMVEVTVDVTGAGPSPLPFTSQVGPDGKTVQVSVSGTLAGLKLVTVRLQVKGAAGEWGDTTAQVAMPDPILMDVVNRAWPHVDLLFTPRVPVPGATLVITDGVGRELVMGEMGPSPWVVRLPDGALGSGYRKFDFRRSDARIWAISYYVATLPGFLTCAVDATPPTLAPGRCARVTSPFPIGSLEERSLSAWGGATFTQVSETEWRICITDTAWRTRPYFVEAALYATSTIGFPFGAATYPQYCRLDVGWDWKDPGAEPVTDGMGPLRGALLAVRATRPDAIRLAYVGAAGAAEAGAVHVTAHGTPAGAFAPGPVVNLGPISDPVAVLGDRSAVAWRLPSPGPVEALLQEVVGASWSAWPEPAGPGEVTERPALARDASGPTAAAWAERLADGTTRVRVRLASAGWTDLPPIAPVKAGSPLRSVTLAAPAPLGAGVVVAFLEEDLVAGRQSARVLSWNGIAWDPIDLGFGPDAFPLSPLQPARLSLAGSEPSLHVFLWMPGSRRPQVWRWEAARGAKLLALGDGNGGEGGLHAAGAPSDGRMPLVAWTVPVPGGSTEVRIGSPVGSWQTATLLATVPAGGVKSLAVDPDGMSVAWTTSDGAIHVRTLTP